MTERATGGCQCGAVRYACSVLPESAHICHCRMCQKAVGNFFAALVGTSKSGFAWTRGAASVFRSSDDIERGFCSACGTPLFYHDVKGEHISVTIGSLDHPDRLRPQSQNGIEGRMPWFAELTSVPDLGRTEDGDAAAWAAAIKVTKRQHPDHDTEQWPLEAKS